ncbi:DNA polymerase III subunit gamma and tau [Microbacterium horticulturae]|uniref:DNA polymerase III subunit gamma/tau n=1 Tax=Microbacterium horticulturae TaxID=3028316 RepID=A0ABY8C571_9MICO|nr:DNA polymerase III subunit gamma and tau [Microbacterium sp. KACC 23027]WEG09783.1 DNA polymerase III subunit gamma and tau [Microbacterium sp. KACC 23027]
MTTALYRRYRPETFAEMIGQAQVTDPLMTALRADRVGHAYLFSGPRGCGKTTSARILARCLNCAEGPTDTPCGTCDSCIELGRGGGGSLDVVEIDAASHNGVDDARDLRERAVFAPARDRFKIFILDEAHMVTPQGFNALLKLVEEPPEHVKFIFATTEPEKVIGTIRSRTHHYPFRLVAPAAMLEYVEQLCAQEGVKVEQGVLPLVVRAGGGSPRDTLSVLDQLIAGSEESTVTYARAVALLGYTPAELLDEVVDAFAGHDAAAAFSAVDRVVQTGQDPRRFVDDLLERLRDLIVVAATGEGAAAVLRGVPGDELARMGQQAGAFGVERLSRTADIVVSALDEMSGATSPRLQLELMIARVLARGGAPAQAPEQAPRRPVVEQAPRSPVVERAPQTRVETTPAPVPTPEPSPAPTPEPSPVPSPEPNPTPEPAPEPSPMPTPEPAPEPNPMPTPEPAPEPMPTPVPPGPVTLDRVQESWPDILRHLESASRSSWLVATAAQPVAFADDVLTLNFMSAADVAKFKKLQAGAGPSEDLRQAIQAVLGVRVKYIARHGGGQPGPRHPAPGDGPAPDDDPDPVGPAAPAGAPRSAPSAAPAAPVTDWAVAPIPADPDAAPGGALAVDEDPEEAASTPSRVSTLARSREGDVLPREDMSPSADDADGDEEEDLDVPESGVPVMAAPIAPTATMRDDGIERVGEAVVRQVLGARFVREEPYESATRFH